MLDNLTDLFNELKNQQTPLADDLPIYGAPDWNNPVGCWSWDDSNAIVGTCIDDLRIVQLCPKCKAELAEGDCPVCDPWLEDEFEDE